MSTLADYVRRKFGSPTTVARNREDTSITTAASLFARGDPQRVQLLIANLGTSRIYVDSDEGVSSSLGIPIDPGGSAIVTADEDGEDVGRGWFAVATVGTQTVFVKEVLLTGTDGR